MKILYRCNSFYWIAYNDQPQKEIAYVIPNTPYIVGADSLFYFETYENFGRRELWLTGVSLPCQCETNLIMLEDHRSSEGFRRRIPPNQWDQLFVEESEELFEFYSNCIKKSQFVDKVENVLKDLITAHFVRLYPKQKWEEYITKRLEQDPKNRAVLKMKARLIDGIQ
jgi:hypothetical protein